MSSFHHSKKRNSGLLYEFLIRRMSLSMVNGDKQSYGKASSILKRYFSHGAPLATEKEIFDVIVSSRGLGEQSARKVLQESLKHCRLLDSKKIEIKKSNLIKDINYTFGQDFFNTHRVPQYRLFASIQMLVDRYKTSGKTLSEDVDKIKLEEALVKYMTLPASELSIPNTGEKIDSLTANLAMRKFEDKYSGILSEGQKKILRKFMDFSMTGNDIKLRDELGRRVEELQIVLESAKNKSCFINDRVMLERLNEATSMLKRVETMCAEDSVKEILMYERLVEEIESDE